ncbi:OmpA family protein [Fodinibius saliphilus]|uniref:OmpA family protein n=1 Tax=Fodinibius saliphilus TaxID=1920650 RepID=UPI001107D7F6|nr:OmpA family protein [Fodinibius saliphilus]
MSYTRLALYKILVVFLLIGCGGPPEKNPLLQEASSEYQKAENDSLIVTKAPVALKEAEEALEQSREFWKEGADKELIEHHAYISKQKVFIARETAELNAAQDEVKRAEAERQRVLIKARKAEARAAEHRAEEALSRAQKAQKRAEQLANRVSELEAQRTERGLVLTLGDVLFDFDKATLKPGGERAANNLAQFLKEYPERNVMIEGFTDIVGSADYNKKLSRRRANAVKRELIGQGISATRIQIRGYGEKYPVASNETEAGRQQNRRVEVIISDKNGTIDERSLAN